MSKPLPALSAAVVLMAGLTMSQASHGAIQIRTQWIQGGPSCQLSVPTTDTGVRPRATGFRNDGTTNAFVICQLDAPDGELTEATMYVTSTDGVSRDVTCTGANGYNLGPKAMQIAYSSKTTSTTASSGITGIFDWTATDFGGLAGQNLPNDGFLSVTCLLPPKTQINFTGMQYQEDVGN